MVYSSNYSKRFSAVDVEQTGDVVISPDIVLHRKTSGFNTVALASALGAAAIICVIIVFISAVVVFRAHDTLKTRIVTYATRQSSSSAITTISVKKNPQTEEQQMLPTAFYELDMQDDETIPSAYNESQKDENKPTEQLTEAVYFTVDDQKK